MDASVQNMNMLVGFPNGPGENEVRCLLRTASGTSRIQSIVDWVNEGDRITNLFSTIGDVSVSFGYNVRRV